MNHPNPIPGGEGNMQINLDQKTAQFIKKSGHEDVYVFVKGCSS